MPSSVDTEIQNDYESRSRLMLPICLYKCFGIAVYMPGDGFNRNFSMATFGSTWPAGLSDTVEVDFFAHSNDVKSITSGPFVHPENKYITGCVSSCTTVDTSATLSVPAGMSPERIDPPITNSPTTASTTASTTAPPLGVKYIVGEITYGGKKSVYWKIEQLERDCKICMMKLSGVTNILDVVSVAVLVNQSDLISDTFSVINNNIALYPNVYALYKAGRFIYIQYSETHLTKINEIGDRVEKIVEEVADASESILVLRNDILSLRADLTNNVSSLTNDVSSLANDVSSLANDVSSLANDVSSLQAGLANLQNEVNLKIDNLAVGIQSIMDFLNQRR